MTTFVLATTSVHTTAAACDYLGPRVSAGDTVVVLGVAEPSTPGRDLGDAANVARARLAPATVETERREDDRGESSDRASGKAASREDDRGESSDRASGKAASREDGPAGEILAAAEEFGADEIVVGRRRGDPSARGRPGLGSTATAVAGGATRPVVVLPLET